MHYQIDPQEVGNRILVKSLAGAMGTNTLAEVSRSGSMAETKGAHNICRIVRFCKADVVILDPFVKCSGAPENDNMAVDFVARILTRIAEGDDVAVLVSHHFRKSKGDPGVSRPRAAHRP